MCRPSPASATGRGWSGVSGVVACRTSAGMPVRRAIDARTGGLDITLPSSTARLLSDWKFSVPARRSSTTERGVSTSTCVVAVAISIGRGASPGGNRLTRVTLDTATTRASPAASASPTRIPQSSRMWRPSPMCLTDATRRRRACFRAQARIVAQR